MDWSDVLWLIEIWRSRGGWKLGSKWSWEERGRLRWRRRGIDWLKLYDGQNEARGKRWQYVRYVCLIHVARAK
jgi:hypothetical protein